MKSEGRSYSSCCRDSDWWPAWDGIVSCCKPVNKVSLGCVEALNNTIRVIQGTACGFRDEGYLSMKIITHFLPPLPDYAKIARSFPSCPFV